MQTKIEISEEINRIAQNVRINKHTRLPTQKYVSQFQVLVSLSTQASEGNGVGSGFILQVTALVHKRTAKVQQDQHVEFDPSPFESFYDPTRILSDPPLKSTTQNHMFAQYRRNSSDVALCIAIVEKLGV